MTETVETRIKLPGEIHRMVKAEAARHGITLAEALGMCVAFCTGLTTPLSWLNGLQGCLNRIAEDIISDDLPF